MSVISLISIFTNERGRRVGVGVAPAVFTPGVGVAVGPDTEADSKTNKLLTCSAVYVLSTRACDLTAVDNLDVVVRDDLTLSL